MFRSYHRAIAASATSSGSCDSLSSASPGCRGYSKRWRITGRRSRGSTSTTGRTYFRATLPAHPEYRAVSALRDVAYLRAVGDDDGAFRRLESAWRNNQGSAAVAAEMIRWYAERDDLDAATAVLADFKRNGPTAAESRRHQRLDRGVCSKAAATARRARCSRIYRARWQARMPSPRPCWRGDSRKNPPRIATSSRPVRLSIPIPAHCTNTRRPRSGWLSRPFVNGDEARAAQVGGYSVRPARCWNA